MAYAITNITAKDADHLTALKGVLKTAFEKPVRVIDEGWVANQLDTEPLTRKQRKSLRALGYQTEERVVYGSFSR